MSSSSASVKVRRLTTRDPGFEKTLLSSLSIPSADDHAIDQVVLGILERIEREGD
ncbi:MAG: histidinol dehydrogenase, partial [Burkholderiaceae bacterium]|nr:histidinol dehydrogenase [Burkholderiaceae bacterium]